jgi:hypothetical protein
MVGRRPAITLGVLELTSSSFGNLQRTIVMLASTSPASKDELFVHLVLKSCLLGCFLSAISRHNSSFCCYDKHGGLLHHNSTQYMIQSMCGMANETSLIDQRVKEQGTRAWFASSLGMRPTVYWFPTVDTDCTARVAVFSTILLWIV